MLSKLSSALYEYELELNGEKTSVHGLGRGHTPEWVHFISSFAIASRVHQQRSDIDSFFEQAFHLADSNPRENVILYAAKRSASFVIADTNWFHYVRWLLYAARRSSTALSFIVEALSALHAAGKPLPTVEIAAFLHQQIPSRAASAQIHEVTWLLFWARELSIKVAANALERVSQLASSAVALVALDLRQRGLIDGEIKTALWKSAANARGLGSKMWLAAYEVTEKGWWKKAPRRPYIAGHEFFGELSKRHVEFYDPLRRARRRRPIVFASPRAEMIPFVGELRDVYGG